MSKIKSYLQGVVYMKVFWVVPPPKGETHYFCLFNNKKSLHFLGCLLPFSVESCCGMRFTNRESERHSWEHSFSVQGQRGSEAESPTSGPCYGEVRSWYLLAAGQFPTEVVVWGNKEMVLFVQRERRLYGASAVLALICLICSRFHHRSSQVAENFETELFN